MNPTAETARRPLTVTCRLCYERFTLNEDGEQARAARTDPAQQMRRHLLKHLVKTAAHGRHVGWLVDALAFEADDRERWKRHLHSLLDAYVESRVE